MENRYFYIKDIDCTTTVEFAKRKELLSWLDEYVNNMKMCDEMYANGNPNWKMFNFDDEIYCILYKDGTCDYIASDYDGHKIKRIGIASIVYSNPNSYVVYGDFKVLENGSVEPAFEFAIDESNIVECESENYTEATETAETTETTENEINNKISIEENTLTINGESTKIVYKNEKHGIYITEVAAKELDIRNGKRYGKFIYTHVDKESCADFTEEIRSEYRNASENIIKNDLASTIQNFISQIDLETFEIGECKNRTLWREHGRKYLTSKVIKILKDICAKYNTYEKIKAFNDNEKAAKAEYERKNFYKGQKIDKTYGGDLLFECMECGKIFTSRYNNAKCRCCGESTQSEWVKEIDWE